MSSQQQEQEQELESKPSVGYRPITLVGGSSLTFVLPKYFAKVLEVKKGDYVRIEEDGKRLIIEKAT